MANNIASGLKRAVILKSAMEAFKHRLVSLGLFSTVFRDVPLEGSNDIEVPYYPLETAAKDIDKLSGGFEGFFVVGVEKILRCNAVYATAEGDYAF